MPGKVTPGVIGAAGNAYAVPVNIAPKAGQQVIKQVQPPSTYHGTPAAASWEWRSTSSPFKLLRLWC